MTGILTPPGGSEASGAREHVRESTAIRALRERGFTADFRVVDGALQVTGASKGGRYRPQELVLRDLYRFEGTSDPDDQAIVYALEARDGTRGLLTDAFGSYADPAVGAVVERIPARPTGSVTVRRAWGRWLVLAGGLVAASVMLTRRRRAA